MSLSLSELGLKFKGTGIETRDGHADADRMPIRSMPHIYTIYTMYTIYTILSVSLSELRS